MRASAALTVVLPTPPFPATMSRRVCEQNPTTSIPMRRLLTALCVLGTLVLAAATGAGAAAAEPAAPHVDVVTVSGLIDPVQADFLRSAVETAEGDGAQALVVQL